MSKSRVPRRQGAAGTQRRSAYSRSLEKGYAAIQRGDFTAAIKHYDRAVRERPTSAEALNDLGSAYRCGWRLEEAISCYERAIAADPEYAPARHNRGITLLDAGRVDEAIAELEKALELRPGHADTVLTLSQAYAKSSRREKIADLVKGLGGGSGEAVGAEALVERALGHHHLGQAAEAIACLQQVVRGEPTHFDANRFLGLLLVEVGRYGEAQAAFERALARRPDSAEVRFYWSLELLRAGRFEEGFMEYEWRWRSPHFTSPRRDFAVPEWGGSARPDATLLVHTEQGFGDSLQFVRFLARARERVGRLVLECEPQLAGLFAGSAVADEIIVKDATLPPHDFHLPLMSLPHRLGVDEEAIGMSAPYLHAGEEASVLPRDPRPTVGLVWAGSRTHANDEKRSCAFAHFARLLELEGIRFVSLQKGSAAADARDERLLDLGGKLSDFGDTARVIRDLDLVVTVDTAVAHLAGALGKAVHLLLPFNADWRWMTSRESSPWYPTMRLFRQHSPGGWDAVIDRVMESLCDLQPSHPVPAPVGDADSGDRQIAGVAAFRRAVAHHQAGELREAELQYREAVRLHPGIPEAYNNLGAVLANTNRSDEARAAFAAAVELNPEYGEALNNLGLLHRAAGELDTAADYFQRAIAAEPRRVDWANNLGNTYLEQLRVQEALIVYDRALTVDPSYVYTRNNRAVALRGLGRYSESIEVLEELLRDVPSYFEAINNLGLAQRDSGDREAALQSFHRALDLASGALEIRINLGVTLQELGRHEEARDVAREILLLAPDSPDAHNIFGHCAYDEGAYEEAYEHFGRALTIAANDVDANWNQALIHLHRGELAPGFAGYEWRKKLIAFARNRRRTSTLEWDGSPLEGRRIAIFSEQGAGDSIQFIRYAKLLKERGAGAVYVECQPELVELLRSAHGVDGVWRMGAALPAFDVHAYMLSLPALLGTELESIPADIPYLAAPDRDVAERVGGGDGELKVGIVWAGSAGHARDHLRSMPLERLTPLVSREGVRFFSLQKGGPEAQLAQLAAGTVEDLAPHLSDFGDTAAAIAGLDLVISVDTSVAHLAGALGTPVWVLLPHVSDFRWMLERTDSPWYPSMRLFRQPRRDDWEAVVADVAAALDEWQGSGEGGSRQAQELTGVTFSVAAGESSGTDVAAARLEPVVEDGAPAGNAAAEARPVDAPSSQSPSATPNEDLTEALGELLRDGDTFIDAEGTEGALALALAASGGSTLQAVAICAPEHGARLAECARVTVRPRSFQVVPSSDPLDTAHLVGVQILRSTRTIVWWGGGAKTLETPAGKSTLAQEQLASVLWRTPAHAEPEGVMDVLTAAGFDSFVIQRDADGVYLDPAVDLATGTLVVSLRRSRLAEFAEEAQSAAAASFSVDGAEDTSTPAAATSLIGIDWPIGGTSGWQVYGTNLATQLAVHPGVEPVLAFLTDSAELPPLARFSLRETYHRSPDHAEGRGLTALRALGNRIEGSSTPSWPKAARNVGVIFFEDTRLTPEMLERARRYDLIVAGSSWNGEVLKAHGLDNVAVSLQGIDPTLFHPAPASGLFGDRFVIFSGGKLEYRKGQDIVIAAYKIFQRRHPDALLLFAWHNHWPQIMEEITFGGHVASTPTVRKNGEIDFSGWLRDMGLPEESFLDLGIVPNAQMGQLLREADVGLFPNRGEGGTNLVAMELMACGVPTILSANTGHLDLLEGSGAYPLQTQGRVAPSRHFHGTDGWGESSVEEIVDILERIYSDRVEAEERAARSAKFMKKLAWARQVEHLLATLSPLL